jgi:hypothetical protein
MTLKKLILAALVASSSNSFASGSYSCCFKKADGSEYTYRGRASTYYTGSVQRLCKSVAIEEGRQQCEFTPEPDEVDLDFVGQPVVEKIELTGKCLVYPCHVGLYFSKDVKAVYVANQGRASCSVAQQIFSSEGVQEHTVVIGLGLMDYRFHKMGGCKILTLGAEGFKTMSLDTQVDKSNLAEYKKREEELRKKREGNN